MDIAKAAIEHAKNHGFNVVILDTAGRLHVDEDMMQELINIKEAGSGGSDHIGGGCHDWTGCGECIRDL